MHCSVASEEGARRTQPVDRRALDILDQQSKPGGLRGRAPARVGARARVRARVRARGRARGRG